MLISKKVINLTLKMFHMLTVSALATCRELNINNNRTACPASSMMSFPFYFAHLLP